MAWGQSADWGAGSEAKLKGGSWSGCGLKEREREAVSGFPRLLVKSLGGEGAQPVLGEGLHPSFPQSSECQGKLQELHRLPPEPGVPAPDSLAPVIPTHQVRSRMETGPAPASSATPPSPPQTGPLPPYTLPLAGEPVPGLQLPLPPWSRPPPAVSPAPWSDPSPVPGSCQARVFLLHGCPPWLGGLLHPGDRTHPPRLARPR